ncbi:hypothetical protein SAMN05443633_101398 [Chryseobacterium arachidis]|uniref:DUF6438 domain-containing protein n=1 Tax=Chryseobacterium arachidis TaxID=1416778 RepID=A0A1M4U3M9_9FLAO|nr:DUF6438 domain-containing protein [Chryseobacterium arachidis]SHE51338.1 hypothetical protein SAMN05443633_101398 [Chryseobacterium arachidis]
MKKIISILIIILTSQNIFSQKFPSEIDVLKTENEVETMIHKMGKNYKNFKIKKIENFKEEQGENKYCKTIADSLGIDKSFYKADFDHNGYTDLLAIGDYYDFCIFVLMNYGKDSLKINKLTRRSFQYCTFPKIDNDSIIHYFYMSQPNWFTSEKSKLTKKDLIFKFGDFIEYNSKPASYDIEKIEYETTTCFGTCPKFYISIEKDRNAFFKAEHYNTDKIKNKKEIKGNFKTLLKKNNYDEIKNLLNYIDFPNLEDNYSVTWSDDQTSTLKITYNNGKVKEIKDYGLIGTYGLNRIYQLFFELRFNQNWK